MVIVNGKEETSKATLMGCMELKKLEVVDYKVTEEAWQDTMFQIYYSMPRNITLEDQLLGLYFPRELGDQVAKITMQKYWLIGVHVSWEPSDQIYCPEALATSNLFSMGSRRTTVVYKTL
jgi:hypothetical protein